jgi:putative thioredoxin
MATVATHVIEVTEQTFIRDVLERSQSVPVVVDFWAEWCGPCRMLSPILERLAAEYDGAFVLAKIDVDQNPGLSQQFGVQGIPAVKAFRNNQVVNEFTGALPEPQVRQFLETLVPSPADLLVDAGEAFEQQNQVERAIEKYKEALQLKIDHYGAMLKLGRAYLSNNQLDEAVSILERIPPGLPERMEADALLSRLRFQELARGRNEGDLRAEIEADPNDIASRYVLAGLLAQQGQHQAAMDEFLQVIQRDRRYDDDGARKAILAILTTLGNDHALTGPYRQKLANALF